MKCIALLRGINVSGQKVIRMADLKKAFESMDYKNVQTYVQSGNVVFDSVEENTEKLTLEIEEMITKAFGFEVKIVLRNQEELQSIINNNPYSKEENIEIDKLHVTLFKENVDAEKIITLELKKEENEKYLCQSREVYLYCPNGYGRTKLTNSVFERKLKITATTRNWKTINKLMEISNNN